jgi:enolase
MQASLPLISAVRARSILDSRGRPTVEVDVQLEDGTIGRACAPSGASTGRHEAVELRDGDTSKHGGLGVSKAVGNVRNEISTAIVGMDVLDQERIDARLIELDGTPNFSRIGGNAALATSLAVCRTAALHAALPLHVYINGFVDRPMSLPLPMTNILSGGAHAGRGMDIQDFLAVPVGAHSYTEALAMVGEVRSAAVHLARDLGLPVLLADEGGLSPGFADPRQALDLMVRAFELAGHAPGSSMTIALDIAASELYRDGRYHLERQELCLSSEEMAAFVTDLVRDYPISSVEDPLDQDDWVHWPALTRNLQDIQILGDDLFVTNEGRIKRGITDGVANAVLIKVNQSGTLSGALRAMRTAWSAGYATIVSARSGETDDSFIADLAVATGAGQIKIGSTRSSERLSKYNQLLRIEEDDRLPFAGPAALAGKPLMIAA